MFQRAVEQYSVTEFERSIALLQRAQELTRDPELLGRIQLYLGVNFLVLGDRSAAAAAFAAALGHDPELTIDPARFNTEAIGLFGEVRREVKGELIVTSPTSAAEVIVDGRRAGVTPYRGRHSVGVHRLMVRSAQGQRLLLAQRVVLRQDRQTVVKVPPLAPTAGAATVPDAISVANRHAPGAAPQAAPGTRLWTWVAAGSAAAALAAGVGLGLSARADHEAYSDCSAPPPELERLQDRGETKNLAANTLFGVAGVLAVTSVILFVLEGHSGEASGTKQASLPDIGWVAGTVGVSTAF
jgi:hypothetical protein